MSKFRVDYTEILINRFDKETVYFSFSPAGVAHYFVDTVADFVEKHSQENVVKVDVDGDKLLYSPMLADFIKNDERGIFVLQSLNEEMEGKLEAVFLTKSLRK